MSHLIAIAFFALLILGLFALRRDRKVRTSKALWIPTAWVMIFMSRGVSQWSGAGSEIPTSSELLAGSPLDRAIISGLLAVGLIVLLCRSRRVLAILSMNWPILLYFSYCFMSVFWSDYPGVAFKRWVRAVGDLVMILVVVSDREWLTAIKRVLTRVGFVLIPFSVMLVEFFPSIGRAYSPEDGYVTYTGVTLNKNTLGMLCLIIGIASVWRLVSLYRTRYHLSKQVIAHGLILALVVWLLIVANSMTSLLCLLIASGFIVTMRLPGKQNSLRLHFMAGAIACGALLVFLLPDAFALITHSVGRNATLTGRTELWSALLRMKTNPWFGTGFASFWLGNRLAELWSIFSWYPNEAHNGYLGIYLDLGWVGITLLGVLLLTGYRNVTAAFRRNPEVGSLMLGLYVTAIFYNLTEEGFRQNYPIWIFLLLAITNIPALYASRDLSTTETLEREIPQEELAESTMPIHEGVV
jgi:exopolysaccharide production protein ExoQ